MFTHYDATSDDMYRNMWAQPYGLLELQKGGTLTVGDQGVTVRAVPFHVWSDTGVADHLKFVSFSTEKFSVPADGSVMVEATIVSKTSGTERHRFVSGTRENGQKYKHEVSEAQQAAAVLVVVDFSSGQLFDFFVSENEVFALVERLPSTVTGAPGTPIEKAYTQIAKRKTVEAGPHRVGIRYARSAGVSNAQFYLDGALFTSVDRVGVPLDKQESQFSGTWPSLGRGEMLSRACWGGALPARLPSVRSDDFIMLPPKTP